MQLSQMQDIGGCRAIMPTISELRKLTDIYDKAQLKQPSNRSGIIEKYDYITNPKKSGYRSYHYIVKYCSDSEEKKSFNGLRIEVQMRTKLQHTWATAVETVSALLGQDLKSGIGDARWIRFFALMGTAMAISEGSPIVPDTPSEKDELVSELKTVYRELNVDATLWVFTMAVEFVNSEMRDKKLFLLQLRATPQPGLQIKGYLENESKIASKDYLELEEKFADDPAVQVVLVTVDSIAALQSAYPNYYLDTRDFVKAYNEAVS